MHRPMGRPMRRPGQRMPTPGPGAIAHGTDAGPDPGAGRQRPVTLNSATTRRNQAPPVRMARRLVRRGRRRRCWPFARGNRPWQRAPGARWISTPGFTLVELLISVAVVAILAAIAYPGYQQQIRESRRVAMQSELMRLAQFMERLHSERGCYDAGDAATCGDGEPTLSVTSRYYRVEFSGQPTADSFELQADPIGAQAGDGLMRINHQGWRCWDQNADGDCDDPDESDWHRG